MTKPNFIPQEYLDDEDSKESFKEKSRQDYEKKLAEQIKKDNLEEKKD